MWVPLGSRIAGITILYRLRHPDGRVELWLPSWLSWVLGVITAWVAWREAEQQLSDAYVRLRKILGAFETPPAPTSPQVWAHTEQCAREAMEALRDLVSCGQCCEAASVGKGHEEWCLASKVVQRSNRFGGQDA